MRVRWRGAALVLFLVVGATTAGALTPSLASAAGPAKSYIAEFSQGAGSARVGIVVQDGRFKA
ncbi:MAG: hypothetical protein MUP67_13830, partial [Acidimicrobiia bacterium]|nr:hypothetical protein [Acidimicrobiia bacterium]